MFFRRRRHTRGQALVEMAILLPVLLLVVLMALDLGRVFFGWVGLQNAVRQGANYAALNPSAWGSPGDATKRTTYLAQLANDTSTLNCAVAQPLPSPSFPNGTAVGARAEVALSCDFAPITPLVAGLFPGGMLEISAYSAFTIRGGQIQGLPVGNSLPSAAASAPAEDDTCTVPSFSGTRKNDAQSVWTTNQFLTTVQISPGTGNYVIGSQSVQGGQEIACDSLITVGP